MVVEYLANTPKNVMENMFNLVGSHDTIRIKRRLKDDPRRVKLAYLWMFLSSGAPNIYYGDEVGMTGEHDPDNRRCMLWDQKDQDLDFYAFVKTLIDLRRKHPSFTDYDYHFHSSDHLMFTKETPNEQLLVIMNNGPKRTITIPKTLQGTYLNVMNNQNMVLHDKIVLEDYDYVVLLREEYHEANHS